MYNKKFVASIKCAGKIMREQDDTVFLPFGSEYSLLLKNLNSSRALVHIEIDGEHVVPNGLILDTNQSIDLERFVVNGDLNKGPRFKFIEKTEQISDHRGDKIDDGIMRISYQFEKPIINPIINVYYKSDITDIWGGPYCGPYYGSTTVSDPSYGVDGQIYNANSSVMRGQSLGNDVGNVQTNIVCDDAGITVKGSESDQKFVTGSIGCLENEKHVIILNIRGQIGEQPVEIPVTVARKIQCNICGKKNKTSNKFCGNCGSNLTYQY